MPPRHHHLSLRSAAAPTARRGLTLVELVAASAIVAITAGALVATIVSGSRLNGASIEEALAQHAAEAAIERIKATPFRDVFATFNADPADDPEGAGSAPGSGFVVPGLRALADDPDQLPGEIVFPTVDGALREDAVLPAASMPRDLDLDGVIDGADHAADYAVLSFVVRIQWTGGRGAQTLELPFNLGDLR